MQHIALQVSGLSRYQVGTQLRLGRERSGFPLQRISLFFLGKVRCGHDGQPLRSFVDAGQDYIFHRLPKHWIDAVVGLELRRIDDGHVKPGSDGVVEENGMHRGAHGLVAPESEREIRNAAGSIGARQVLLDPADGFDEVNPVAVVLSDACAYREDVNVENDLLRRDTGLCEQPVGTLADGDFAGVGRGLSRFVESHHHHGGAEAADFARLGEESFFAFLQADGVDDTLALGTLETGQDTVPVGRVDHQGGLCHGRIGLQKADKSLHGIGTVEQGIVHVDVDDIGTSGNLGSCHFQCGIVVTGGDEPCEFARSCDVGTLADEREVVVRHVERHALQAADSQERIDLLQRPRRKSRDGRFLGRDVYWRGAATAADDIDQSGRSHLPDSGGHLFGRLVVEAHLIGQACIRIADHGHFAEPGHLFDERQELFRTERTVEAEGRERIMTDGCVKGIQRLAGKDSSGTVSRRHRNDDGKSRSHLRYGIQGSLGIKRVETGFNEQQVDAALDEGFHLFPIDIGQYIERQRAGSPACQVGGQGQRF